jgi:hypothetical protein
VRFAVDNVALRPVSVQVLRTSFVTDIPPKLSTLLRIYDIFIRTRKREILEHTNKAVILFAISGSTGLAIKTTFTFPFVLSKLKISNTYDKFRNDKEVVFIDLAVCYYKIIAIRVTSVLSHAVLR